MEALMMVETRDIVMRDTTTTMTSFRVVTKRRGEGVIAEREFATEDEAARVVRAEMALGMCDEVSLVEHRSVDHWIPEHDLRWHEDTDEVIACVDVMRKPADGRDLYLGPRTREALRDLIRPLVIRCDGASV